MQEAKKILLVEDDPEMAELLLDILLSEGYNAIVTDSRLEAERIIREQELDLILLDLILLDGDGFDLCRKVSLEASSDERVPVFILSGKTALEVKMKSFLCGAKKYFTKPFNVEELLDAVRIILTPNRTPQSVPA